MKSDEDTAGHGQDDEDDEDKINIPQCLRNTVDLNENIYANLHSYYIEESFVGEVYWFNVDDDLIVVCTIIKIFNFINV